MIYPMSEDGRRRLFGGGGIRGWRCVLVGVDCIKLNVKMIEGF